MSSSHPSKKQKMSLEQLNYSHLRGLPRDTLEEVAFAAVQANDEALKAGLKVMYDYQEKKRKQEEDLKKEIDDEEKDSEDDEDKPPPLKCKKCIVSQRNEEPKKMFCWGCHNRVCRECSDMCKNCDMRWCSHCREAVADDPFQEHCCHRCHFSMKDYARRYWDSDEYNSSELDSD